jgi:hypothetical protein
LNFARGILKFQLRSLALPKRGDRFAGSECEVSPNPPRRPLCDATPQRCKFGGDAGAMRNAAMSQRAMGTPQRAMRGH